MSVQPVLRSTWQKDPVWQLVICLCVFVPLAICSVGLTVIKLRDEEQKALFAEYLQWNAWRAPNQAIYAKALPAIGKLERIDLATEPDGRRLNALVPELKRACKSLELAPRGLISPGVICHQRADALAGCISDYFDDAMLASNFRQTDAGRKHARLRAANWLFFRWERTPSLSWTRKLADAKRKEIVGQVNQCNDASLHTLLVRLSGETLYSLVDAQTKLQQVLDLPPALPEGLDPSRVRNIR